MTLLANEIYQVETVAGALAGLTELRSRWVVQSMRTKHKEDWRSHWLNAVKESGIEECDYLTLPGPEMKDVFLLLENDVRIRGLYMFERDSGSRELINRIAVELIHRNAIEFYRLYGDFEVDYSKRLYCKNTNIIFNFDLCGALNAQRYYQMLSLINSSDFHNGLIISNFMPHTDPNGGLSRCCHTPAMTWSKDIFGSHLESLNEQIIQDLALNAEEYDVKSYPTYYYYNGIGRRTSCFATNIISLKKKEAHNEQQEDQH